MVQQQISYLQVSCIIGLTMAPTVKGNIYYTNNEIQYMCRRGLRWKAKGSGHAEKMKHNAMKREQSLIEKTDVMRKTY